MRIGITGWSGFIGSHLKDKIKNPILYQDRLEFIDDVLDFVSKCDRIYHLAGRNRGAKSLIINNNLIATGNLILAVKQQKKQPEIIFASSTQVDWNANSDYGIIKLFEELIISQVKKWCIYRIPNVYGEGARPFYNSVVATFAYNITHGRDCIIKNPHETRDFIYIDDLVKVLLKPKFNEIRYPRGERFYVKQVYDFLMSGEHAKLNQCLEYYRGLENVSSSQGF